jgi:TonB family protein
MERNKAKPSSRSQLDQMGALDGNIRLLKSAGFEEFDAEALAAVTRAASFPATGRPQSVSMRVHFENPVVRSDASIVGP